MTPRREANDRSHRVCPAFVHLWLHSTIDYTRETILFHDDDALSIPRRNERDVRSYESASVLSSDQPKDECCASNDADADDRAPSGAVDALHRSPSRDMPRNDLGDDQGEAGSRDPHRPLCKPHGHALFDMERSGAAMAWDFFVGGVRPEFIEYVQDRDLWSKQLPGGDEFTIALRSYPQDFAIWDELVLGAGAQVLIDEGRSIQRYYRLRVEELKRSAYQASLGGHPVWIANAPYFAASEVAGELCERGAAFGACYFEVEAGRFQYSLRSRGDFDVSAVARLFGGGGHKNAAGFTTSGPAHSMGAA